jgi:hypothetical protein
MSTNKKHYTSPSAPFLPRGRLSGEQREDEDETTER